MTMGEIVTKAGQKVTGFRPVATKDQKVVLAYVPFCPYHAHTLHPEGEVCSQWMRMVNKRQIERQAEVKDRKNTATLLGSLLWSLLGFTLVMDY